MDRLKKVFEFMAPSTATGFLMYGWIGSLLAGWGSSIATAVTGSWLLGMVVVFVIWVPLWLRAKRAREEGDKLQGFVNDLHKSMLALDRVERDSDGRDTAE